MLKSKIRAGLIVLLLSIIFLSAGAVAEADFPVTVNDDLGQEVTLEEKPEKIISLAPSNTEALYALELEDKIIGVTTYCNYPPEVKEKETIGSIVEPNIEKIVSMEPDLIMASAINDMSHIERLQDLGLTVAGFNATSVDDTINILKKMGALTGQNDVAQELVTDLYLQLAQIQELVDSVAADKEKPKVFYEIWSDPFTTAGENTFIDDLINLAGGENIGAQARGQWPQYSLEKLLLEDPEVYISSPHSAPHQVTVDKIKERENFDSLTAVQEDRVHIVNQDIISRPSPRIITGLKLFVKAIHPEIADQVDEME